MIVFKDITFKNFLSCGNQPTTINLSNHKTTLIYGVNGSGKSTILDALTYSLFGRSFRPINLPQLINTQNGKHLLVEVSFTIGKDEYVVRRGMKPKVFEIYKNGNVLDSNAADKDNQNYLEQAILKMTFKSFSQIVILGSSSFVPFMKLPAQIRRECVEDFLDIKVFSTMQVLAKEKLKAYKLQSSQLATEKTHKEDMVSLQVGAIHNLNTMTTDRIDSINNKIADRNKKIEELENLIVAENCEIIMVNDSIKKLLKKGSEAKIKEYTKVQNQIVVKKSLVENEAKFYKDSSVCHTCHQEITEDTKNKHLCESEEKLEKFEDALSQIDSELKQFNKIFDSLSDKRIELMNLEGNKSRLESQVNSLKSANKLDESDIQKIKTQSGSIDAEQQKLKDMENQIIDIEDKISEVNSKIREYEIAVSLLKDSGVKSHIVRKYLPAMNGFIKKYLTYLDLPIHFELTEELDEVVKSPLYQDFSYSSFSEGQKSRIDIALMFAWRDLCKLKNSVSTPILILDEVFSSSLDDAGKDLLMNILKYKLGDDQNVLVINHTLDDSFKEKFDRRISVKLEKGFSSYTEE